MFNIFSNIFGNSSLGCCSDPNCQVCNHYNQYTQYNQMQNYSQTTSQPQNTYPKSGTAQAMLQKQFNKLTEMVWMCSDISPDQINKLNAAAIKYKFIDADYKHGKVFAIEFDNEADEALFIITFMNED